MVLQLFGEGLLIEPAPAPKPLADHADCCCEGSCEECAFATGIPASWLVDLGTSNWTDNACDYCDQIEGQFTLTRDPSPNTIFSFEAYPPAGSFYYDRLCLWKYEDTTVCSFDTIDMDLHIYFYHAHRPLPYNDWKWILEVQLVEDYFVGSTPNYLSLALYKSSLTTDSDCYYFGGEDSGNKLSLPQTYEAHRGGVSGDPCAGSGMPDPVELWVP